MTGLDSDHAGPEMAGPQWALLEALGAFWAVKRAPGGPYVAASTQFKRLLGIGEGELGTLADVDLFHSEDAAALRRGDQQALALGQPQTVEQRIEVGGRRRAFTLVRLPLDGAGLACAWLERTDSVQRDTQLARAMRQIEQHQAEIEGLRREMQAGLERDEFTGLQVRGPFEEALQREIDLSLREQREFSVVLLALDGAETTPASSLDPEGNKRLLAAVGRLLRANTRAMDMASRVDEARFAVLLSGVGLATAYQRMDQVRRQAIQQIVAWDGRDLGLSLSMGVASFPLSAASAGELIAAAQRALKAAQSRGGQQMALASIPFRA